MTSRTTATCAFDSRCEIDPEAKREWLADPHDKSAVLCRELAMGQAQRAAAEDPECGQFALACRYRLRAGMFTGSADPVENPPRCQGCCR